MLPGGRWPKKSLVAISISVQGGTEEIAEELLSSALCTPTATYTDFETGRIVVTSYLDASPVARTIADLNSQLRFRGIDPCNIRRLKSQDWAESWKKHFKPILVKNRLLIRASWHEMRPKPGQLEMVLDPGLSFGTGNHETTRFCLDQLVLSRKPGQKQSLLDIGTGSGILAIAGARLGYQPVDCFDFDPQSIRVAKANVLRNQLATLMKPARKDLRLLSLRPRRAYDFICANLLSELLLEEKPRILAGLKPGGRLVLAGILARQFEEVRASYEAAGLTLETVHERAEWKSGLFLSASAGKKA